MEDFLFKNEDAESEGRIKILGHRGLRNCAIAVENTIHVLSRALQEGDGVEADVTLSADGVPYLMHDTTIYYMPYVFSRVFSTWHKNLHPLSREAVAQRPFHQMYSGEIDRLYLKHKDCIPHLSELFSLAAETGGRKILNLELKSPDSARPVLQAIYRAEEKGLIDREQVIISSFDHKEIKMVQALNPMIRTGLIYWHDSVRPCALYPGSDKHISKALPVSNENLKRPRQQGMRPDYFIFPARGLKEAYAAAVAQDYPGSKFILWTPGNEPAPHENRILRKKLADPGIAPLIEAVITTHPEDMKMALR